MKIKRLKIKNSKGVWVYHPCKIIKETDEAFILAFPIAPLYIKKANLKGYKVELVK